ncbi:Ribosomal S4P [Colwellia chukchiensis]|uniref:Ribosomal S4P n=1 Tax=Colwellia chukchiensis TaxID=641665 RepID=A0A1H7NSR5_9GAMM|nr:VC2046/SO_2500 family protein [Colwellia chukchiensis]SEL26583.1 Ribosomal S4P [Colwellia chukchiensis]
MTPTALNQDILVHELQLGEQLNESVHQARRADFSLMLAMLTDDVRAHSQFHLPQTQLTEKTTTSDQLRKFLQLPKAAPLALDKIEDIATFNQASAVERQQLTAVRLTNALAPKPLAFRDDRQFIPSQVLTNTSLHCQQRHQQNNTSPTQQRAEFDAKAWLNSLQSTMVKAPLMQASA